MKAWLKGRSTNRRMKEKVRWRSWVIPSATCHPSTYLGKFVVHCRRRVHLGCASQLIPIMFRQCFLLDFLALICHELINFSQTHLDSNTQHRWKNLLKNNSVTHNILLKNSSNLTIKDLRTKFKNLKTWIIMDEINSRNTWLAWGRTNPS